jgi:hypothetical protein
MGIPETEPSVAFPRQDFSTLGLDGAGFKPMGRIGKEYRIFLKEFSNILRPLCWGAYHIQSTLTDLSCVRRLPGTLLSCNYILEPLTHVHCPVSNVDHTFDARSALAIP